MDPTTGAVGATAIVLAALISAAAVVWRVRRVDGRDRDERHKERLRSIYADVMLAAIRLTPKELHLRVGSDDQLTADDIDRLSARLSLEHWNEGDRVRDELKEVWRASQAWSEAAKHDSGTDEAREPIRRRLLEKLDALEDAMRAGLGTTLPPPGTTVRRP